MEQVFVLMAILGGFTFLGMGLSIGNSIEVNESEKNADIMIMVMLLGMVSFIIGIIGVLATKLI